MKVIGLHAISKRKVDKSHPSYNTRYINTQQNNSVKSKSKFPVGLITLSADATRGGLLVLFTFRAGTETPRSRDDVV